MVRALHEAGIEVILDVVYNHTAEGNHLGPTLSHARHRQRRLLPARRRRQALLHGLHRHRQHASTSRHPHSLQLIMDSLRYWVTEMHVDGFRFDLAATLAREFYDVDRLSTFFELVQQDPTVSQVKLIAEPWDVGPGGYQVGNFPPQWTEWNGKYRDTVRDFWRGEPATLGEFAVPPHRLRRPLRAHRAAAGRVDQLRHRPRRLHAARPGLLQREAQRGQRRGQQRRREPQPVVELRRRGPDATTRRSSRCARASSRNFLATLLLSPGRADDLPRRRARPHPGRQQQRLLPGQRDHLGRLGTRRRRPARVHPAVSRAACATTRSSAGAASSTAGRSAAAVRTGCPTSRGSARTARR